MAHPLILALDQGTTSTRAILFDLAGQALGEASRPLAQHYPADGWVEHDAEEIYEAAVMVMAEAVANAGAEMAQVAAIGITNQRETVVLWDGAEGSRASFSVFCALILAVVRVLSTDGNSLISNESGFRFISGF